MKTTTNLLNRHNYFTIIFTKIPHLFRRRLFQLTVMML